MGADTFGWEYLMKNINSDSLSKRDIVIAFIHWRLLKKNFSCLGVGKEKTLSIDEKGCEILPKDWNKTESYSLRYKFGKNLFLLHGTDYSDMLIINLLDASDLISSNVTVDVENTVQNLDGKLSDMIPSYKDLTEKLESTLFKTFFDVTVKTSEAQTDVSIKKLETATPVSTSSNAIRQSSQDPIFPNIGGSDLNPFSSQGGGMIFDPLRRPPINPLDPWGGEFGRLPRGAIPPGARFDPIINFTGERFNNPRAPPDADHLQPPGYDDMFS